jgi:hypothetical protein
MMKPLEFERVSVEEAQKAIEHRVHPGAVKDWEGKRLPAPAATLTDATAEWLRGIPLGTRPVELARQFPRIANRLCELWKRPAQCEGYLKTLIMDERGGRKGFPPEVATELSTLSQHYATLYPYRKSIWEDVLRT